MNSFALSFVAISVGGIVDTVAVVGAASVKGSFVDVAVAAAAIVVVGITRSQIGSN